MTLYVGPTRPKMADPSDQQQGTSLRFYGPPAARRPGPKQSGPGHKTLLALMQQATGNIGRMHVKGGAATKGVKTEAKAKAARKNGAKGGRPKHKEPSAMALAKRRSRTRLLRD
jgi:hypothetical protein